MKRDEILARAKSAIGNGTLYRLGGGAPYTAPHPWDEQQSCDCSGFVLWVLGLSRHVTQFEWLNHLNGGWLNTDGMVEDSLHNTGYFRYLAPTLPPDRGDLIVYPSRSYAKYRGLIPTGFGSSSPRIGHVGIVGSSGRVIHCSAGNYKNGDAIQETSDTVFKKIPYHTFLTFSGVE